MVRAHACRRRRRRPLLATTATATAAAASTAMFLLASRALRCRALVTTPKIMHKILGPSRVSPSFAARRSLCPLFSSAPSSSAASVADTASKTRSFGESSSSAATDSDIPVPAASPAEEEIRRLESFYHSVVLPHTSRILRPKDASLFDEYSSFCSDAGSSDAYLDREAFASFARIACEADGLPRKELFESWSVALHVREAFLGGSGVGIDSFPANSSDWGRVADLACGHGMVGWALLFASQNEDSGRRQSDGSNDSDLSPSVVCVDSKMPPSATKLSSSILSSSPRPNLVDQWDYVEGKLDSVIPSPSTVMVGVHACGTLTDRIITIAIEGNCPVCVVPCCHSRKALDSDTNARLEELEGNERGGLSIAATKRAGSTTSDTVPADTSEQGRSDGILARYVDDLRIKWLEDAGFKVEVRFIPEAFTPMNRVLLAWPPPADAVGKAEEGIRSGGRRTRKMPIAMPQLNIPTTNRRGSFEIPLGNDSKSRSIIHQIAGRDAAERRKQPDPPSLCVSLFLPPGDDGHENGDGAVVTPEALESLVASSGLLVDEGRGGGSGAAPCSVEVSHADEAPFEHPSGRMARTFRVVYRFGEGEGTDGEEGGDDDGSTFKRNEGTRRSDKERAKELHGRLCGLIPESFPGAVVR